VDFNRVGDSAVAAIGTELIMSNTNSNFFIITLTLLVDS
jgi:hypothetical protein